MKHLEPRCSNGLLALRKAELLVCTLAERGSSRCALHGAQLCESFRELFGKQSTRSELDRDTFARTHLLVCVEITMRLMLYAFATT